MESYERYAKLRDIKGYNDSYVAKLAKISPATLTAWKQGTYEPKLDTLRKIASVLNVAFYEIVDLDKYPALAEYTEPKTERELFNEELLRLYHNATAEAQSSVLILLKNSQKEG